MEHFVSKFSKVKSNFNYLYHFTPGDPDDPTGRTNTSPVDISLPTNLRNFFSTNTFLADNVVLGSWQYVFWMIGYCLFATAVGASTILLLPDPDTLAKVREEEQDATAQHLASGYDAFEGPAYDDSDEYDDANTQYAPAVKSEEPELESSYASIPVQYGSIEQDHQHSDHHHEVSEEYRPNTRGKGKKVKYNDDEGPPPYDPDYYNMRYTWPYKVYRRFVNFYNRLRVKINHKKRPSSYNRYPTKVPAKPSNYDETSDEVPTISYHQQDYSGQETEYQQTPVNEQPMNYKQGSPEKIPMNYPKGEQSMNYEYESTEKRPMSYGLVSQEQTHIGDGEFQPLKQQSILSHHEQKLQSLHLQESREYITNAQIQPFLKEQPLVEYQIPSGLKQDSLFTDQELDGQFHLSTKYQAPPDLKQQFLFGDKASDEYIIVEQFQSSPKEQSLQGYQVPSGLKQQSLFGDKVSNEYIIEEQFQSSPKEQSLQGYQVQSGLKHQSLFGDKESDEYIPEDQFRSSPKEQSLHGYLDSSGLKQQSLHGYLDSSGLKQQSLLTHQTSDEKAQQILLKYKPLLKEHLQPHSIFFQNLSEEKIESSEELKTKEFPEVILQPSVVDNDHLVYRLKPNKIKEDVNTPEFTLSEVSIKVPRDKPFETQEVPHDFLQHIFDTEVENTKHEPVSIKKVKPAIHSSSGGVTDSQEKIYQKWLNVYNNQIKGTKNDNIEKIVTHLKPVSTNIEVPSHSLLSRFSKRLSLDPQTMESSYLSYTTQQSASL